MPSARPAPEIKRTGDVVFTGIIEELGKVQSKSSSGLQVESRLVLEGSRLGDSISVNGTCLTVTGLSKEAFSVDIVPETWRRTALGELQTLDLVNLERPLSPNGRLGGHFVQGHIDGTARIVSMTPEGDAVNVRFQISPDLARYVVEKGFIAVDGISLTVTESGAGTFGVTLIPFTREHTNFQARRPGASVNVEVDILAKYVERFVRPMAPNVIEAGRRPCP